MRCLTLVQFGHCQRLSTLTVHYFSELLLFLENKGKERRRDGQRAKQYFWNLILSILKNAVQKFKSLLKQSSIKKNKRFLRFYPFFENTLKTDRRMENGKSETGVQRWDSGAGERWALYWTRASDSDTLSSHPHLVPSLRRHEEVTTVLCQCNV